MATGPEREPAPNPAGAPEQFDERVRAVVEESRDAEREAIGRRFEVMARQREDGMIERLTTKAGLTSFQSERMTEILGRRREAIGAFFRSMFSGDRPAGEEMDFAAMRKKVEDVRAESDEEIRALLAPDQYEAFQAEDQATRRGPWFMGGGGGDGTNPR